MKKILLFFAALVSMVFVSCEDDTKKARVEIWLTDDPGDYQEVNIDLQAVEVHSNESGSEEGWQTVAFTPEVYNLLDYTNGKETLLGGIELPGDRLSQIRLKLGDNNTVKVDEQVIDLTVPSGQQSGLKIRINEILEDGITYKITLDFEAGKSVVKTGNGKYILKPSIRAITEAASGAIRGSVNPAGIIPITLMAADTVNSTTSSDEEGKFLFSGIKTAGNYKLVFDGPGDGPAVEKADVVVVIGTVTDVGVVEIGQ